MRNNITWPFCSDSREDKGLNPTLSSVVLTRWYPNFEESKGLSTTYAYHNRFTYVKNGYFVCIRNLGGDGTCNSHSESGLPQQGRSRHLKFCLTSAYPKLGCFYT